MFEICEKYFQLEKKETKQPTWTHMKGVLAGSRMDWYLRILGPLNAKLVAD